MHTARQARGKLQSRRGAARENVLWEAFLA